MGRPWPSLHDSDAECLMAIAKMHPGDPGVPFAGAREAAGLMARAILDLNKRLAILERQVNPDPVLPPKVRP